MISREEKEYYESVHVLNCGGTIDMSKEKDAISSTVLSTMPKIANWLKDHKIQFIYSNVFDKSLDSSNIGEEEWDILFKLIKEIILKKQLIKNKLKNFTYFPSALSVGGIVVSHGSDTLPLTSLNIALRLSLEELGFPIIFTCSFATIDVYNNDIYNNLVKSICAAKGINIYDRQRIPPQVYVFIGDEIHLASRSTKVYTTLNTEGKYFFSYPFPVGKITSRPDIDSACKYFEIKIKFDHNYFDFLSNSNSTSSWKVARQCLREFDAWPIVEHILIDSQTTIDVLNNFSTRIEEYSYLNRTNRFGLILQGNFSRHEKFILLADKIKDISENYNIVIMVGSKDVYQRLMKFDIPNIECIHKSLSYSKARVKLLWLLKLNLEISHVIKFMNENIAGEIAEVDNFPDWIQYENFEEFGEKIPIYPNIRPSIFIHAVDRAKANLNPEARRIFMYGFGNGHIPTIREPIGKIVMDFINELQILPYSLHNLALSNNLDEIKIVLVECIINYNVEFYHYLDHHYTLKNNMRYNTVDQEKDFNLLQREFLDLFAMRLIKDALMNNNSILKVIGDAIDDGIRIHVKTTALGSKSNHTDYPVGRALAAIGVDSDKIDGWKTKLLTKKK